MGILDKYFYIISKEEEVIRKQNQTVNIVYPVRTVEFCQEQIKLQFAF